VLCPAGTTCLYSALSRKQIFRVTDAIQRTPLRCR
jgi:hypothetical protein